MKLKLILSLLFACVLSFINAQSTQETKDITADLSLFKTPMAMSLKKEVKKEDIDKIKTEQLKAVALLMLNHQYDTKCRAADYKAYLKPTTLGRELMIGDGYSKYENITGVYLSLGKHIVLVNSIAKGKKVNLLIPKWNRHAPDSLNPTKDPAGWGVVRQEFKLHNGVNVIEVKGFDGLAYIDYYSDIPENEKAVQVHFVGSQVNGYFDLAKNNNSDWNKLIDNAVYPIIDARGRHIQIAYPVADCKKYAYNKGVELINNYDSLVYTQYQILGLVKYHKVPKNHILARVNYNYYMFRDGDGVAYMGTSPGNAMPLVVNPAQVIKGDPCWGFSHEVGHVHQLRPYFNWGGLGEVSNNIFSLYGTTSFGNRSRLSEQKSYQRARDSIIALKASYLQDKDLFVRLVPFWQLQLYFAGAGQNKDFYPDLFEAFRLQGAAFTPAGPKSKKGGGWGDRGDNPAVYQLNFVKTACVTSKTDLIAFFDKYGFFYVGEFDFDDYGKYKYNMTKEMVDNCKAEIKAMNLPQPKVDISTLED